MFKTSKKFIALFLVLTMVLSMAACGKKSKDASTDAKPTSEATKTEAAVSPTEAAAKVTKNDTFKAIDLGGREIKVGIWWDYYYSSANKDIKEDPALTNAETAQMKLDNVRRIETKYNCKVTFVNLGWTGIINSINTSIAAGTPECDVYLTGLAFGIPAALNGLATNLEDLNFDGNDLFGNQSIVTPLKGLGGTFFFSETGLPISGYFMGYNKTMVKDLGLEDPQQLYKDGKWTWDKMAEMAKAATKDTNGDGTMDQFGYSGAWTGMIDGFVQNNGGNIAGAEDKKEGLSSKPVMEVLEFISRLYNTDKSARPWNEKSWDDNTNFFSTGKSLFWHAQAWLLKQEADKAAKNGSELPFEYGVVPYPVGPSGDGKLYSPPSGNQYIIPVGIKEPEKVLQVMEEFFNWYDGDIELRDDPSWFESCFQSEEDVDMAYQTYANVKLDPWGSLSPYFDMGSTVFMPTCVKKDKTVAQAVEAAKPTLQNAMDYLYSADKSEE